MPTLWYVLVYDRAGDGGFRTGERSEVTIPKSQSRCVTFRALLLPGCCSLYCAILKIQPRSDDKCATLLLNQLRGVRILLGRPFADSSCNLGDVETNHAVSLSEYCPKLHQMATSEFPSFVAKLGGACRLLTPGSFPRIFAWFLPSGWAFA